MRVTFLRYASVLATIAILLLGFVAYRLSATADDNLPHVHFNADDISPRQIEDLTSKSVPRDYALAWQTMEQSLSENRTGLLDGYFTGFAKQDLTQRVNTQARSGLRTHYTDRGHKVDAVFYSPSRDVMELRDHAQFDMQILDGGKVIYEEPVNEDYVVLMTPGADRWLVRQLQALNGK